jgi:hypothetical protein
MSGPTTRSVEVAGIEPASVVVEPGLLRAQCGTAFLSPGDHPHESPSRAQSLFDLVADPVTGSLTSGFLADVSYRVESKPWLTEFAARSGGEGEFGARVIGTYWFAMMVYEITSPSRPASPGSTYNVEACHPLCSCQRRREHVTAPAAAP